MRKNAEPSLTEVPHFLCVLTLIECDRCDGIVLVNRLFVTAFDEEVHDLFHLVQVSRDQADHVLDETWVFVCNFSRTFLIRTFEDRVKWC